MYWTSRRIRSSHAISFNDVTCSEAEAALGLGAEWRTRTEHWGECFFVVTPARVGEGR